MKFITQILPCLLFLLPLTVKADYVKYALNNGTTDVISFITPTFLPDYIHTTDALGNPSWTFYAQQLLTSPCSTPNPIFVSCQVDLVSQPPNPLGNGVHIVAFQTFADGSTNTVYGALSGFNVALDQFNSERVGNFTFSVTPTQQTPTIPEPGTVGLLLTALVGLSCCGRLRRAIALRS